MRYVKLFEAFRTKQKPSDVIALLRSRKTKEARLLLKDIIDSSKENRMQYDFTGRPPIELEKSCGIKGVSKIWKMPFGMTEKDVEFLFRQFLSGGKDERKFLFDALLKENPDLIVPPNIYKSSAAMNNIFVGCTSSMRLDDMLFYITEEPEIRKMPTKKRGYLVKVNKKDNKEYSELYTSAQRATSFRVGWFPCPKTLEIIIRKMSEKNTPDQE